MTAGTEVVKRALKHLNVHSPLQEAPPESLEDAKHTLNGMLSMWEDRYGINMGTVPLNALGDELSEPLGAKNEIEYCLAMSLAPFFPGAQVSAFLPGLASAGFQKILATWADMTIPKIQPRNTLPKGQGNLRGGGYIYEYAFYPRGSELG